MSVLASPLVAAITNPVIAGLKKLCQPAQAQPGPTSAAGQVAKNETTGIDAELRKTGSQTQSLTVAGLLKQYVKKHSGQAVSQVKSTLTKLALCPTRALGGRVYRCDAGQSETPVYNSCGDRHCPECRGARRGDWLESTSELLIPGVTYFQVAFTLPEELSGLALGNRREIHSNWRRRWRQRTVHTQPRGVRTPVVDAHPAQRHYQVPVIWRLQ